MFLTANVLIFSERTAHYRDRFLTKFFILKIIKKIDNGIQF